MHGLTAGAVQHGRSCSGARTREIMSLAQLRERAAVRMGKAGLGELQRPTFHHLITLSSGSSWHTVDFTGYALKPGSWLWVRPGQVQQWGDLHEAEGTLIVFERGFLDPGTVACRRADATAAKDGPAVTTEEGRISWHWRSAVWMGLHLP